MKTTLKTAKFTLKTAFARCVAANTVAVSCILVANAAVGGVVAAVYMCYSDDCEVYLRRKCGAEMAKIWCGNGEIVVYFRRVHA